jgi:transaldolase
MTVLARDLLNKNPGDDVRTPELKYSIRDIYQQIDSRFDKSQFDKDWKNCYSDERCSISHGRGSKLVDPRTSVEYDKIVNMVGGWARDMVYYYINKYKT